MARSSDLLKAEPKKMEIDLAQRMDFQTVTHLVQLTARPSDLLKAEM